MTILVIAIIALILMLSPSTESEMTESPAGIGDLASSQQNSATSLANPRVSIQNVSNAMLLYCHDNDDRYPSFESGDEIMKALFKYLEDPKDFAIPGSYTWNANLSGQKRSRINSPSEVWLMHTTDLDSEKKVDVGFADGNCKFMLPDVLDKAKASAIVVLKASNIVKGD
jgi:hypothetical protein